MKFSGIHIIIFYFFSLQLAFTQGTNPFDIKSRLGENQSDSSQIEKNTSTTALGKDLTSSINEDGISEKTVGDSSQMNNPFDIGKDKIERTQLKNPSENIIEIKDEALKKKAHISTSNERFLFWIILFSFLLLATVLSLDRFYIFKLVKSILNYNLSNSIMRDNTGFNLLLQILLFSLFILSASIYVYLLQAYFTDLRGINYYWISLGSVFLVYFIRHSAMRLLMVIFPRVSELAQYSFTIISFNIVLGIVLLFPSLFMAYSQREIMFVALLIGIVSTLILYLLRSFRGLLISLNYLVSIPFHFFLYLCAFEIIPLMFIYKLIVDFV